MFTGLSTSQFLGGPIIPSTELIFYAKAPEMVDSIGLSANALWAALPTTHRSIYLVDENTLRSAGTIITNIEASEYLNAEGGTLKGLATKSYAQYADGTDVAILTKADKFYRFFTGAMTFVFFGGTDAEPSATNVESNTITIPNIALAKSYTVTGGTASKNGGAWGASGSVVAGDTLKLRGNASASFETTTTVTMAFGADESTFSITTRAADTTPNTTPNAFSFTDATGVNLSTVTASNAITVAGIEAATSFTVTGGTAEKNTSGTWAASGTVANGDTVKVRGTSSASYETAVNVVLTIGGVSDTFTITTKIADTTPASFSFVDKTNIELSTLTESAAITVSGIDIAVPLTVTGGEAEVNSSGVWVTSGTVESGNTVKVRRTSSAEYETAVNVVLNINGVSDTFTITTRAESGGGSEYDLTINDEALTIDLETLTINAA